jgi:hypothetical protein
MVDNMGYELHLVHENGAVSGFPITEEIHDILWDYYWKKSWKELAAIAKKDMEK